MCRLMKWRVSAFSAWWLANANVGVWTTRNRISSCRPCHASARPRSTEAELRERREVMSRKPSLGDVGGSPRGGLIDGSPASKLVFRANAMMVQSSSSNATTR